MYLFIMTDWKIICLVLPLFVQSLNTERIKLSCAQKRVFVDGHNQRRFKAAQGLVPRQPAASNMRFMVWDEELAEKAARWAENGVFAHNPDRTIGSKRWELVGENVYMSLYFSTEPYVVVPNIDEALDSWFNEHQNYGFEPFELGTEKPIGHYTQMVWADTTRVGCGIAQRKNNFTETLFVCDYGPMGNYFGKLPYATNGAKGNLICEKGMNCRKPYGVYC